MKERQGLWAARPAISSTDVHEHVPGRKLVLPAQQKKGVYRKKLEKKKEGEKEAEGRPAPSES